MIDFRSGAFATPNEVRRAERYSLPIPGVLREPGVPKFNIMLRDVSVTGFACDTGRVMNVGARVWVTIGKLAPLEAEVRWRDGFYYGFAFVRPLYPAVLDHIARQASSNGSVC